MSKVSRFGESRGREEGPRSEKTGPGCRGGLRVEVMEISQWREEGLGEDPQSRGRLPLHMKGCET